MDYKKYSARHSDGCSLHYRTVALYDGSKLAHLHSPNRPIEAARREGLLMFDITSLMLVHVRLNEQELHGT